MAAVRARIAVVLSCVALIGVAVLAHLATWEIEDNAGGTDRYIQHEQAAWLDDLSEEDREAASSTSTDPATFASHLPVVSIDTGGQEVPGSYVRDESGNPVLRPDGRRYATTAADGSEDITASFSLFYREGHANRLSDDPALSTSTLVHYRGHTSRDFPKRNYALHFVDEDGNARNEEVLGMPAENGWILNGPYLDKSLIRNYLAYNVFGEFCENTPEVRFCELFVNGEYRGLFLLMEAIDVGETRVDLTEVEQASNSGDETSYLIKLDRYDMYASTLETLGSRVGLLDSSPQVLYPNETDLTEGQKKWIEEDFSAFEKALYSYDYDTDAYGYWNYIDVDSFVDYFIANEFSMNYDAGLYSTYLSRDLRGLIKIGPIWDFNSAFDNYVEASYAEAGGFVMVDRPWYTMLVKDEGFTDAVIERYRELRAGPLSEERLLSFVDATVAYLDVAVERNWSVWGWTFTPEQLDPNQRLIPIDRNPCSYDEALDDLRDFIERRGSWLDRCIENLRQYSHESAVKMDNH